MLFKTNAFLATLVIIPVPLGFFAIKGFWAKIRIRYRKQWRADSRATSILHDIIKGIRVVKAFGNEESEITFPINKEDIGRIKRLVGN